MVDAVEREEIADVRAPAEEVVVQGLCPFEAATERRRAHGIEVAEDSTDDLREPVIK